MNEACATPAHPELVEGCFETSGYTLRQAQGERSGWLSARLGPLLRVAYLRYLAASGGALAVDLGLFLLLLPLGMPAVAASGIGYAAGIGAHWWLSSRVVFAGSLADAGQPRRTQAGMFLLSALAGLGLTMGVVALGARLGLDPRLGKLVAIGLSFQAVWLLRRHVVFGR